MRTAFDYMRHFGREITTTTALVAGLFAACVVALTMLASVLEGLPA